MAKAADVPLRPDMSFAEAAVMTVEVRAAELWEHSAGVLDTSDIERVHAMRVATRRLRAVLEIFAPAFPRAEHKAVLREVKALADALGARRDPDVQLEALRDVDGVGAFVERVSQEQARGNDVLAAALAHAEEAGLREQIDDLVAAGAPA
jgi:CHAD domain-containing protein